MKNLIISSCLLFSQIVNITQAQEAKLIHTIENADRVAFSQDGKYFVTTSNNHTAKIFETATGRIMWNLAGHTDKIVSAQFSSDGKFIVTASHDRTVKIWEATTGKLVQDFLSTSDTHDYLHSALFNPDGKYVITKSQDDKTAKIWESLTGKLIWKLTGHTEALLSIELSADGKYTATSSFDKTAKIWGTATGKLLQNLTGHTGWVFKARFSPDGKYIVTVSEDRTAKIWETATGRLLRNLTGHSGEIYTASFSPDGRYVITTSEDKTAKIWETTTGRLSKSLTAHTGVVNVAIFSPDKKYIVTSSVDKTSKIWEAESGALVYDLSGHAVTLSNDGKYLATASIDDSTIKIWDMTRTINLPALSQSNDVLTQGRENGNAGHEAKLLHTLTHPLAAKESLVSASFSPEGQYVITASTGNNSTVWETASGRLKQVLIGHTWFLNSAEFSSNGKYAVTASMDKSAKVWEISTGRLIWDLRGHTHPLQSASFSPDDKYVVTTSQDKTAKIWNMINGRMVRDLKGHSDIVRSAQFSPDGKYVVTAADDKTAKIWESSSGRIVQNLKGHTNMVVSAQFSPSGKYVITASFDKTAKIWECASGTIKQDLIGHTDYVNSAYFSPDEKHVVTTSTDKTAKMWHISSGRIVLDLQGHTHFVETAEFSRDGKYLLTASLDHTTKIWELATGKKLLELTGYNAPFSISMNREYVVTVSGHTAKIWKMPGSDNLADSSQFNGEVTPLKLAKISKKPPLLTIDEKSIKFSDSNGNNILEAGETAKIVLVISNNGRGSANDLKLNYSINGTDGISIISPQLSLLEIGKEQMVEIKLAASNQLKDGKAIVGLKILEPDGFDSQPVELEFKTKAFEPPNLVTVDEILSVEGGGTLMVNRATTLEVLVQNIGKGIAEEVVVKLELPENVLHLNESEFRLARLTSGESKSIKFEFIVNARYSTQEIPLALFITEKFGKFGSKKPISAQLNKPVAQTRINVQSVETKQKDVTIASLRSDVDKDIPLSAKTDKNKYALVIGNEDYKTFQSGLSSDQNVLFARNDASVFREYVIKTLGVPEEQTILLTDATRAQMNREIERLVQLAQLTSNAELIFYYAGHGFPDMESGQGYLIPVDVTASHLEDAISLKELYAKLASAKASRALVFLDACFSGGGRGNGLMASSRTVKIKPKGDIMEGNIVAFTASSGDEVSLPLRKESHGLFTYHLLRKLKDTQGKTTLEQLKTYLESEVPRASLIENGLKQTPQVLVAPDLNENWLSWSVRN